jgi:hypothetical protein
MSYWLAAAARELREQADRKQVHVAAGADVDQSTVWRFEHSGTFPRNVDSLIAAYAEDLSMSPIEIWAKALEMWREANGSEPHADA